MARALHATPASAEDAAALGLTVAEASHHTHAEVWPENLETVNVFIAMDTQWRSGPGGATGLDYSALPAVFDLADVPASRRREVFDGLRAMEEAALAVMHGAH